VYSTDVVPDALITQWLNESYFRTARQAQWPWTATALVTGTDTPAFDAQFHAALAYEAAITTLAFVSDDTKRSESYASLASALIVDMAIFYLPAAATGAAGNLTQMVRMVRDTLGMYDNKAVTDAIIKVHINRAYNELARMHDWDWLETSYNSVIPAAVNGAHTIALNNGTRRVLEAYLVDDSGEVREIVGLPNLDRIPDNTPGVYYDVNFSGQVIIRPEQESSSRVKIRYTQANVNLGDNDGPLFADQFDTILVYRAAVSILSIYAPDDKRGQTFMDEYTLLYEGMRTLYELDHDFRSIQLGEEGLNTRRYYPWFKPA
jgi:hypothetical protein